MMKKKFATIALCIAGLSTNHLLHADEALRWNTGHADLRVDYIANEWNIFFNPIAPAGPSTSINDTIFVFEDSARAAVPNNPNFLFLGSAGDPIWIMSQVEQAGIPFVGTSSDTILGVFQNDDQFLQLTSVDGPGNFFMWSSGSGTVNVQMDSSDGIDATDQLRIPAQSHLHNNWGFSSPGTYRIGLKAIGTLSGQNSPVESEDVFLRIEVGLFQRGELDIDVAYEEAEGELHIGVHQESTDTEFESVHVALQANPLSWTRTPNDPSFAFLGDQDSEVFTLPQNELDDVLFLGIAGEEIPNGIFENNTIDLNLISVTGPGEFALYVTDSFGVPTVYYNSATGSGTDTFPMLGGTHQHANWVFTSPGIYRVELQASGTRASDQQRIQSESTSFLFEVISPEIFEIGELDIDIALDNGELNVGAHQEATDIEYCAEEILLRVTPLARTEIPNDPQFAFLGSPEDYVHLLPQNEAPGLLFLGIATEEIPANTLVDDLVDLSLVSAIGPGNFAMYQTDAFGLPTELINTADGIDGSDIITRSVGEHAHVNWAFSTPGIYHLKFVASATLVAGNQPISSEEIEFRFDVINPTVRDEGELDFEVAYKDGAWELAFLDEETESEFNPNKTLLVGAQTSLDAVPSAAEFSFLGTPNSPVWILPQSEIGGLLFLGIAGDEIALGTFENDDVSLQLVGASGPGDFSLFQVDTFGTPTAFINSGDGLDASDVFPVPVGPGGHTHANWAFSAPGKYQLQFRASGTPSGEQQVSMSKPVSISFIIMDGGPLLAPQLVDGGSSVRLDWMSKNTVNYQLQSRTDVTAGDWVDEGSPFTGIGGQQSITVPLGIETLKTFQVVELQQ